MFRRHITFDAHSRKNNLNSLDGSLVLKVLPFTRQINTYNAYTFKHGS